MPPARLRTEYMPLDDLRPADRNAKEHDDPTIDASIERFGFIEPVILDERTGQLVAGHGRRNRLIAKRDAGETPPDHVVVSKGVWLVPVERGWASKDDDEALAAGIALNRTTETGGWNRDLLFADLGHLQVIGAGFEGLGFTALDYEALGALAGNADDLNALGNSLGSPGERDFWPIIRLVVSPETKARWDQLVDTIDDEDGIARFFIDAAEISERETAT